MQTLSVPATHEHFTCSSSPKWQFPLRYASNYLTFTVLQPIGLTEIKKLSLFLFKGSWESEYYGAASGVEQLLQLLRRENWSGASGCTDGCVLVHVNRQSTAQYLASYLSNCRELLLRNVTTTWFGAPDKGKALRGLLLRLLTLACLQMFNKPMMKISPIISGSN